MSIVSISIVVYKPDLDEFEKVLFSLIEAIDFCHKDDGSCFEVYVLDNSVVGMYQEAISKMLQAIFNQDYVKTRFIDVGKNLGYGKAHNIPIKDLISDYHLVLNPDVFLEVDSLFNAIAYMENNPTVGLLSPSVCGSDGERHYLCKKNPTLFDIFLRSLMPIFLRSIFCKRIESFEMRDRDYNQVMFDVPFLTGCFMFFRADIFKKLNGFDDRFFMYFEDADISRRLLNYSHSAYVPNVKIIHAWAGGARRKIRLLIIIIRSVWAYWRKWGGIF